MRKLNLIEWGTLLALLVYSCNPVNDNGDIELYLRVGTEYLKFGSGEETKIIEVQSVSEYWTIESVPEWAWVQKDGKAAVKVTTTANTVNSIRKDSIVLKLENLTQVIRLEQEPVYYFMLNETRDYEFDDVVDRPVVTGFKTNVDGLEVVEKPEWVTLQVVDSALIITPRQNQNLKSRTGEIVLDARGIRTNIKVSQAAKAYLKLLEEPNIFHYLGGMQALTFESNREGLKIDKSDVLEGWFIDDHTIGVKVNRSRNRKTDRVLTLDIRYRDRRLATIKVTQARSTLIEDQRAYLIKFFESTGGENWKDNTNWLSDRPISEWYGLSVSENTGELFTIKLEDNNLVGVLPDGFSILLTSRIIRLNNNVLNGELPKDFDRMVEPMLLNMSYNNLTGSIPSNVCDSRVTLNIKYNRLSGVLPECMRRIRHPQQEGYGFDNEK